MRYTIGFLIALFVAQVAFDSMADEGALDRLINGYSGRQPTANEYLKSELRLNNEVTRTLQQERANEINREYNKNDTWDAWQRARTGQPYQVPQAETYQRRSTFELDRR